MSNNTALDFNFTSAPGTITYAFLTNVASGTSGTLYAYAALGSSKTPGAGDKLSFASGALTFTLT